MKIELKELKNGWKEYSLVNNNGMAVSILNYGGIITKILVPDKNGIVENVVLGYQDYSDYENDSNFFGAMIGPVAGRIEGAAFELEGRKYKLENNEGKHHLHGGTKGFDKVLWKTESFQTKDVVGLKLIHSSPHNENGYPGNVKVTITYKLKYDNELEMEYEAISDCSTPLTLANHTYFNLSGNLNQTIQQHQVTMNSNYFLELDKELIPTGNILNVNNTPFDFTKGRKLADGIENGNSQNEVVGKGYDHYFIFNGGEKGNIGVFEESSRRALKIETDQPGMVMYTANNLNEGFKLAGGKSKKYLGVCFETQSSPASLHYDGLPSILLDANKGYSKKTVYRFEVEK